MTIVNPFARDEIARATAAGEPSRTDTRVLDIRPKPETEFVIRVLIIDDDPDILENIAESLPAPLFQTRTTGDGEEFRGLLTDFSPDIVITDMAMPACDGMDILRVLRDEHYTGEVILISGAAGHVLETARRIAGSYALTISGILRKPFTTKQLLGLIHPDRDSFADEGKLSAALSERRILPYFQPKVDLKTGHIVGAEALSRWYHPKRGLLFPQAYLGNKRAANRHSVHDYTIMERAIAFCGKLEKAGHHLTMSVNFTAEIILSDGFLEVVADALQRHGVSPDQFIAELVEPEENGYPEDLAERLLKLRLLGAHLSINNFGADHSSFSRIQTLPISEVKIDRSLVRGLVGDSTNSAIAKTMVDLAHSIHCQVVAEGVESGEALEVLTVIGCDLAQGYLFSPAVNEVTFGALIQDNAFAFPVAAG